MIQYELTNLTETADLTPVHVNIRIFEKRSCAKVAAGPSHLIGLVARALLLAHVVEKHPSAHFQLLRKGPMNLVRKSVQIRFKL